MSHKTATAAGAAHQLEHLALEEAHQGPGARQTQHQLVIIGKTDLLEIEAIGLDEGFHAFAAVAVQQIFVDVVEQRGMDVWQPGDEPVGGKRQHSFRR
ncbi:hypothetical protein D9M71_800180 [compost metagenome]